MIARAVPEFPLGFDPMSQSSQNQKLSAFHHPVLPLFSIRPKQSASRNWAVALYIPLPISKM